MNEAQRPPKIILRAIHRAVDGTEHTSEREVVCDDQEQLMKLICAPSEALPQPPDARTHERFETGVAAVRSWMSRLQFVLEETIDHEGGRRCVFGLREGERSEPLAELPPQRVEVEGHVHVGVHEDDGAGGVAIRSGEGQSIHVANTGLMVWNRDNIYVQVAMNVCVKMYLDGKPVDGGDTSHSET